MKQDSNYTEPRKDVLLKQKEEIVSKFIDNHIKLPSKEYQSGIDTKKYYDDSKYEGQMRDDKREGYGIYNYANGDIYCGQWKNNVFDGNGHYIFASGERYSGE